MPVTATLSLLVNLLQPYRGVIYPVFFLGFVAATFVAIRYHEHRLVRTTYVAGFFALLVVVNVVVPAHALPMVHWHKFSEPRPQELAWEEVRVVDADGRELVYDDRATLGVDGVTMEKLQHRMRTRFSDAENCATARWLLQRASAYRDRVADPPATRWLRFPPHGLNNRWSSAELEGYDAFVGLRVYGITVTTSADGTEVLDREETALLEVTPDASEAGQCAVQRAPAGGEVAP